jgi:long-chain acyl-CoA synthetase
MASGSVSPPLQPENMVQEPDDFDYPLHFLLERAAEVHPDEIFTVFNDEAITYAQMNDMADRLANFLATLSVGKGSRVAVCLPGLPRYPAVCFGILKTGASFVPLSPQSAPEELHRQLVDSGVQVFFCAHQPPFYDIAVKALAATNIDTVVVLKIPGKTMILKRLFGTIFSHKRPSGLEPGHLSLDEVLAEATPQPPRVKIDPKHDVAALMYTGGTTGVPKAAQLSHANYMSNINALKTWTLQSQRPGGPAAPSMERRRHCFLGQLPWHHNFGLTTQLFLSTAMAGRLICIPDPMAGRYPFTSVLEAIQKHAVTVFFAFPRGIIACLENPFLERYNLSSIMVCSIGGSPLPLGAIREFEARTGIVVYEGYGLSETSPVVSLNPFDPDRRRLGTVGLPLPGTTVKILDVGTGCHDVDLGRDGEIAVSGPQVMLGYRENPAENSAVFRIIENRTFLMTGDMGHMDIDGYLVITGRKKELIIVSGLNVYPNEVEETLYHHPKVARAGVIGIPDRETGEAVKAFVQLKQGVEASKQEIIHWCRERISDYKCPTVIEFRDTLPVSVFGKIRRTALLETQDRPGEK